MTISKILYRQAKPILKSKIDAVNAFIVRELGYSRIWIIGNRLKKWFTFQRNRDSQVCSWSLTFSQENYTQIGVHHTGTCRWFWHCQFLWLCSVLYHNETMCCCFIKSMGDGCVENWHNIIPGKSSDESIDDSVYHFSRLLQRSGFLLSFEIINSPLFDALVCNVHPPPGLLNWQKLYS